MSRSPRLTVTLSRALYDQLDALTREPGVNKATIIADALADWLARKGDDALELRFAHRLERVSLQLSRIERNGHIELESLGLFIRYMLTVNPPLPESDLASRALGRDRFAAFVERVGQQLASGRSSLAPEERR